MAEEPSPGSATDDLPSGPASEESPTGGPGEARFLLDVMLGKLATYLRMCGYDAAYALDRGVEADDRLREWAREESRTLLTRDRTLAASVDDSLRLTARDVADQLREFSAAGYPLELASAPVRCGSCNGRLEPVDPAEAAPTHAPDDVDRFRCRDCGQQFWRGSHWDRVGSLLAEVRDE